MATLDADTWGAISPYLDEALGLTGTEQTLFVASVRAQNPKLATLLKELLDEHGVLAGERFLEQTPISLPAQESLAGRQIGTYTLLSSIGRGGMGTVWLAERSDGRFERQTAVKFLNLALADPASEQRFKREGSILGRLSHPNIAELIDAGVSVTGQPYLVLEYVDGEHIDQYCDHHGLDVEARIHLFLGVLAAVAHAHTNLIVHRDIKPSNVLVRSDGQVKLLDFGIAKLLEEEGSTGAATLLTREGGTALTPEYAAPEQLTGGPVTTATDIYTLGVLLYVLLTGQHPAGAGTRSPAELVKAIVETEPLPLSQAAMRTRAESASVEKNIVKRAIVSEKLHRALKGDLETIAAKALKKRPQQRYASVTAFAEDLRRYLKHEPISARPDSLAYRAGKFVRRNRTAVALALLAFLASLAGLVGTITQAHTARAQRDFALRELSRAETINDLNSFLLSDAAPSGKPFTVDGLLTRAQQIVERQPGDNLRRVELLISIGSQYTVQDEYTKARPLLESAYRLSQTLPDISTRARAACSLARTLSRQGELSKAEALFRQGMRGLPDDPIFAADRVDCLLRGSDIAQNGGDAETGIARAQAAQSLLQKSPYRSELLDLDTQITLASAYSDAGRHQEAGSAFHQAADRLAALGRDKTQMASTVFNNWGVNLILAGQPLEAEKVFRRSISIARDRESEQTVQAQSLVNYARALYELGRFDEAGDYVERGYIKAREVGDEAPIGQALLLKAAIYRNQGDLKRSGQMLAELEPLLRRDLPPGHVAFGALALQRALNAQAQGDKNAALQFADEAVATAEALVKTGHQGRDYLPTFLVRRSGIRLAAGMANEASADAARALGMVHPDDAPARFSSTAGRAYLALGRALQARGKYDQARAAIRSALQQLEETSGPDHPDTRTARELANKLNAPHQ